MGKGDPDQFVKEIVDFTKVTHNKINRTIKGMANDFFQTVIDGTPVDSGAAKNNWVFSAGTSPDTKSIEQETYDKKASATKRAVTNGLKRANVLSGPKAVPGTNYYLTNSLDYIMKLELGLYQPKNSDKVAGGFSKQAPGGFIRKNVRKTTAKDLKQFKDFGRS
jgi:hypothetical protein